MWYDHPLSVMYTPFESGTECPLRVCEEDVLDA
jgi:hypothetical protein